MFDIYLLKFNTGAEVLDHKDPSPIVGHEHHRLNIVLKPAIRGGKFVIQGRSQEGRVHRFRPDKYKHKVTKVKEGTRYVLSIGWLRAA